MKSAVVRDGAVVIRDDVPEPRPGFGQVLVQVRACGVCGSDLHFVKHGSTMLELASHMEGVPAGAGELDPRKDVFIGHEFSCEVLEAGPDTEAPVPGSIVTSVPVMVSMEGVQQLSYNNKLPGGYSERMLLSAPLLETVPRGLDPRHAALAEPMAVGLHAVNRSGATEHHGALVLGCGPIGLAVIAALKLNGVEPIVASDFSASRRRLAATMGAHVTNDPSAEPAYEPWARAARGRPLVVYEAIGVPGIIDDILRRAPMQSRVVVVGVCMQPDAFTPFYGITKELNLQFVLGYDPAEFKTSLHSIAEGHIDVTPMITGEVDIDGLPGAFDALADPAEHCKILVVP